MKKAMMLSAALLSAVALNAKVTLPHVFGDNMVLQQKTEAAVWGSTDPGKKVTITASWTKAKTVVTADNDGKWSARISTPEAGGPHTLTFNDGEKLTLSNVMTGEVWFCSGQSNMQMPVRGFGAQPVEGSIDVIMNAKASTPIRICTIRGAYTATEQQDCNCEWQENTPEAVAETSATAYFFAQQLNGYLDVPVGIIISKWGGTRIESWMSRDALLGAYPNYNVKHLDGGKYDNMPKRACTLFNAMVAPVIPYTIKGWLWYQGEANRKDPGQYYKLMQAYAKMMRDRWGLGDIPFYYAQIAPYQYENKDDIGGALLMEVQEKLQDVIPASGMATTQDIGDCCCIHPSHKKEVGQRLALLALARDYGMKAVCADAPRFDSVVFDGKKAVVKMKVDAQGLAPLGHEIFGFEVAGEDRVFHPAKASIGKDRVSVEVRIPSEVASPVAVRYAFHNYAVGNLKSTWGIPAGPFRSDDWE